MNDPSDELKERFLAGEGKVPTSRLTRLWKTGTSAASMGAAVLGGRWKGRGEGLQAADIGAIVQLVERLGELKGIAMKAGQILGYVDPSLSPELRRLLSVLQTASPASPFSDVERAIVRALETNASVLVQNLEKTPVAVASIGQVHHGTLPDGREVAVKVLHPGIEAALESDLASANVGSAIASTIFGAAGGSVKSFVEEVRTALLEECDLRLEASRQTEFGRLFENDLDVRVPPVLAEWSGPGLLTTGWMPGRSLDEWLEQSPPSAARNRVGEALFRFYFGTLYQHGLFHADPHPGNYALQHDDRIVIYDFGCVRRFDSPTVAAFASLVTSVRSDDRYAMADALHVLGAAQRPRVNEQLRGLLRGFFGPLLVPGRRRIEPDQGVEAHQVLRDKRAVMQLALPGKLLFLFRLRFGLYAVLSRIGAEADWCKLETDWAREALSRPPS